MPKLPNEHSDVRSHPARRRFLRAAAGAVLSIGAVDYAEKFEPDHLVVTRTDVVLPHWPFEADGVRIGQLSDFHADYEHAVTRCRRAAEMLMAEKPDLVFLTGDYVTSHLSRRFVEPTIAALAPAADAPRGAYAIMGNHDCWGNTHDLATLLLERHGFQVLNNRCVPFPGVPGAYIVGLDDAWCGKMNVKKALRGVPRDALKLVALHEPDFADSIGQGFDLQLSGHSHGGQIRIPGLPVLHAPAYGRKYPEGLQQAKNHLVYTTRGVGMIGPQIRTFCPPEVTLLTLRTTG